MDYHDDIFTTLTPEISDSSTSSSTLRLYDIFIPLLGFFIISLNLLVVISSGLLLKKRKISSVSFRPFICRSESICRNKNGWHIMVFPLESLQTKSTIKKASSSSVYVRVFAFPSRGGFLSICLLFTAIFFLGQQPRSTYLFLGNVGLSDLVTGIAIVFGQLYPTSLRSDLSCAIHMGELKFVSLSSDLFDWAYRFALSSLTLMENRHRSDRKSF